jgi:formate hydrogenlyase transcriptional activator
MFFVQKFAKKLGKQINHISPETLHQLVNYPWPGNIRELQNIIERAVVLSTSSNLALSNDLQSAASPVVESGPSSLSRPAPLADVRSASSSSPPDRSLEEVERRHIESVLTQTNWMIEGERGAAQLLNLNPSTLRSRMKKLGIKRVAHSI